MSDTTTAPPPVTPTDGDPAAAAGALPNPDAAAPDATDGTAKPKPEPQAAKKAAAKKQAAGPRPHGVFHKVVIDLNGDPATIINALREKFGVEKPLYTLVRVTTSEGKSHRQALEAVDVDLNGNYEVIADKDRLEFKDVKSEIRRAITFG